MISEIKYNGFSASPSDYESLDGDLAAVVGLVPEDGALKPIAPPQPIFTLAAGQRVVVLHKTSAFTHYIIQDNANSLYWSSESGALKTLCDLTGKQVYQITTIGNTVIALCDDGMHYMLWKNGDYTYLGNKIPECPISFGLQGMPATSDEFTVTYNNISDMSTPFRGFSDENKAKITEQVLAKVNSFIAEQSTGKGKFIFPFFVRYAYRLFDGSLSHHSAPILMLPSTWINPIVPSVGNIGETSSTFKVFAVASQLDYQALISESSLAQLEKWEDVVKSVDVFISAPIYSYDQSGEVKCFNYRVASGSFYGKYGRETDYKIHDIGMLYQSEYGSEIQHSVSLPTKEYKDFCADIADCSQFYFLKSIDIKDLKRTRTAISIPESYLQSLVAKELMSDDYQTHDTLIPSFAKEYNARLNIANIKRRMFEGYDVASMVCYINKGDNEDVGAGDVAIWTDLNTSNGRYLVNSSSSIGLAQDARVFPYLFYPDAIATRMRVRPTLLDREEVTDGMIGYYLPYKDAPLKPHAFLNGAVYFNGFPNEVAWDYPFTINTYTPNPTVSLPNKIYTSEINNPFHFPLNGINTIGTGEIVGISTAAKALSEGQFGQFPLYAFATDGVWALEVSATGAYSAKQPITRDVCLSKDSITQIDSSVLFATDRGIMLLSGSQSICISDILDSAEPFALASLPQSERLLVDFASLAASNATYLPFREYVAGCRMIYDYVQQRVVVINPNCQYAYVYSFESKAWGIMPSTLKSTVNSYPEALAMDGNNRLVDISKANTTTGIPIFFVTRPIKIEADVLKTIDTIIQRGYFKRGHVKMALYGSRDLFDWFLVSSSADHYLRGFRGTPYKYFRIAVIGALDHNESITGATIQFTPRQINQPR
jgi:hypothetical protein